jgi:hypothetical protein
MGVPAGVPVATSTLEKVESFDGQLFVMVKQMGKIQALVS